MVQNSILKSCKHQLPTSHDSTASTTSTTTTIDTTTTTTIATKIKGNEEHAQRISIYSNKQRWQFSWLHRLSSSDIWWRVWCYAMWSLTIWILHRIGQLRVIEAFGWSFRILENLKGHKQVDVITRANNSKLGLSAC